MEKSANQSNLEKMRAIIEKKQAKSAIQRGLDHKASKSMGEKRKKMYNKKPGGLFDK